MANKLIEELIKLHEDISGEDDDDDTFDDSKEDYDLTLEILSKNYDNLYVNMSNSVTDLLCEAINFLAKEKNPNSGTGFVIYNKDDIDIIATLPNGTVRKIRNKDRIDKLNHNSYTVCYYNAEEVDEGEDGMHFIADCEHDLRKALELFILNVRNDSCNGGGHIGLESYGNKRDPFESELIMYNFDSKKCNDDLDGYGLLDSLNKDGEECK